MIGRNLGLLAAVLITSPALALTEFLEFNDILHAQRSKIQDVFGIYRDSSDLYTFFADKDFYYKTKYREDAKDPLQAFSDKSFGTADSTVVTLDSRVGKGKWLTIAPAGPKGYFLFDAELNIGAFDNTGAFIRKNTLVIDLLRPAADARGEPTRYELAAFRQNITAQFNKFAKGDVILAGVTPRFKTLPDSDGAQYLASTRLPNFTITTLKCDDNDWGNCHLARGCFISYERHQIKPEHVVGMTYSEARDLVLVGDTEYNRIFAFKYNTCHHVVFVGLMHLPTQLKELRSIEVDSKDRLWVSTKAQDEFRNASVYVWPANKW